MADQPWLQPDDQLLLDDTDYRVASALSGHADRLAFQRLTLVGQLSGESRMLLQTGNAVMTARDIDPAALAGEQVELDGRTFSLRWDSDVRTERKTSAAGTTFGRGRCAWYEADDGAVAALIVERSERIAFMGEPLEPSRVDLRFTEALRDQRA